MTRQEYKAARRMARIARRQPQRLSVIRKWVPIWGNVIERDLLDAVIETNILRPVDNWECQERRRG